MFSPQIRLGTMIRSVLCNLLSLCVLAGTVTSCSTAGRGSRNDVLSGAESVAQVLSGSRKQRGERDVRVAGYFDGHFEGSALRNDTESDSLSLHVPFSYAPVVKNCWRTVDRSEWQSWEKKPVVIEGVFFRGDVTHMGGAIRDVAILRPARIVTVTEAEVARISGKVRQ